MKLRELAERLQCRLEGDGDIEITRVAGLEQAGPGDITFFANPRYAAALRETRASAVILGNDVPAAPCAILRSSNPYLAFAEALDVLSPPERPQPYIHPLSAIGQDVVLGVDVTIGPYAVVGDGARIGNRVVLHAHAVVGPSVVIGDDTVVHSHVSIREGCRIGNRVVIQNGAVIGSDGFGFVTRADGTHRKIAQRAPVVIEDDVEIGANTTIDRPAVGETRIRSGAKIDNLVQIAHGVQVGENALLAAQVGIAGSTVIGRGVMLAGQVGVSGHIEIGDGVRATAQTGIPNSVEAGALVSGYPAIDNREWLKASAVFRRLPELKRRVNELAERLAALEAALASRER
ncbi:MAG TPA: UDP-3-O-(3-hydroxymyristoyl)glucosamine N-acyltransferase [Vicinamibacterales bacterium]|nr:UDP-3-O-(3-hydroxymyristoyl)glucosamine N-acyltransferase [Vicinamibacterales bacterium]